MGWAQARRSWSRKKAKPHQQSALLWRTLSTRAFCCCCCCRRCCWRFMSLGFSLCHGAFSFLLFFYCGCATQTWSEPNGSLLGMTEAYVSSARTLSGGGLCQGRYNATLQISSSIAPRFGIEIKRKTNKKKRRFRYTEAPRSKRHAKQWRKKRSHPFIRLIRGQPLTWHPFSNAADYLKPTPFCSNETMQSSGKPVCEGPYIHWPSRRAPVVSTN